MHIPKIVKIGALIAAGAAAAGEGSCVARQVYRNEPVDKFVRVIDSGNMDESCKNPRIRDFTQSLIDNKDKLMESLRLSEEDYNLYCKLGIAIAKKETQFGLSESYCWKKNTPVLVQILRFCAGKTASPSKGMTNIKFDDKGDAEKARFKEFGVTSENIFEPEKSAVATIIHLYFLNRAYNNGYLVNIAPKQDAPLTREEYLVAKWRGKPPYETIVADRTLAKPKDYVWNILRSLNYSYDSETDKAVDNSL